MSKKQNTTKYSIHDMEDYDPYSVEELLTMNYQELVSVLLKKYGPAKCDYFRNESFRSKNQKVTRTSEGLLCHHIDEDKAIKLSQSSFAAKEPFEYQKAHRLVYCNLLEHLLLHVKIAEKPDPDKLCGIGGAVCFICKELNDVYSGKKFTAQWRINVAEKVKDNYDDYITVLRYFWEIIEENYGLLVRKESLCENSDGEIVKKVWNDLSD